MRHWQTALRLQHCLIRTLSCSNLRLFVHGPLEESSPVCLIRTLSHSALIRPGSRRSSAPAAPGRYEVQYWRGTCKLRFVSSTVLFEPCLIQTCAYSSTGHLKSPIQYVLFEPCLIRHIFVQEVVDLPLQLHLEDMRSSTGAALANCASAPALSYSNPVLFKLALIPPRAT